MAYPLKSVRTVEAEDGSHRHIDLVGYLSPHTPYEPVMVPVLRILEKMALDEDFFVERDGERIPVKAAKCEVCGHEPYLKTEKDPPNGNLILELPEI